MGGTTALLRLPGDDRAAANVWRRAATGVADGSLAAAQWSESTSGTGGPPERLLALTLAADPRAAGRGLRYARSLVADAPRLSWLDPSLAGTVTSDSADRVDWAVARTPSGWHTTYWISVWPPDPRAALATLMGPGARVSLAVHGGHAAALSFTGLLALTAADPAALAPLCTELEQRARSAGSRLVRLDGEQAAAYAATLPGSAG